MYKVKILGLFFSLALTVMLVACGMFATGGGDPNDDSCDAVQKKHESGLRLKLSLTCKYKEPCDASMFFGWFVYSDSTQECYGDYEYKFVSKEKSQKIRWNTNLPVTVDDDDHVRFSLFDSEKVEKTYDIDLSEIIHSYTVKDDSVEIKMPYKEVVLIRCPICKEKGECCYSLTKDYCQYDNYTDSMKTIMVGKQWDYSYYVKYSLSGQSSFGADSIAVTGNIYFR